MFSAFLCTRPRRPRLLAALLGGCAGAAVFLWLYGAAVLNPGWDAWILNGYDEWDVQQHYAGWLLFRNSHWSFPLGLADTLAVPDGTVISYTDSLPWVSIFFKLLRGVLPATFQWFGLYTLLCFYLQGAAGALLCSRGVRTRAGAVCLPLLTGALFACLPTLWERAFRHVALASQWLFLLALYALLEERSSLRRLGRPGAWRWAFPVLAFGAVGIHPYFLPPVMVCALLAALDRGRLTRAWRGGALDFALSLAAALAGGVLCGAIGGDSGLSRHGYGEISMNLNALWNPSSRGGYTWSRLLPALPQQSGQYDGFNYLGLGVLVLLAVALVLAAAALVRRPAAVRGWWGRNWPTAAACAFLAAFAVSNTVTLNEFSFTIPLPGWLLELCGIFRSSGRMFYLVAACMLVWAVYTLRGALAGPRGEAAAGSVRFAGRAVLAAPAWPSRRLALGLPGPGLRGGGDPPLFPAAGHGLRVAGRPGPGPADPRLAGRGAGFRPLAGRRPGGRGALRRHRRGQRTVPPRLRRDLDEPQRAVEPQFPRRLYLEPAAACPASAKRPV